MAEDHVAKDHGPTVKNDAVYEALLDDGASKEKAARIANAQAAGTVDHDSTPLEDRPKDELYDEAKELAVEGRSQMSKEELIEAIREG